MVGFGRVDGFLRAGYDVLRGVELSLFAGVSNVCISNAE